MVILSVVYKKRCRKCSPALIFLLFFPILFSTIAKAQSSHPQWDSVTRFLQNNIEDLGGRAVLLVYKDGKIVYNQNVNELSQRQKRIQEFLAKRKDMNAVDASADFDENTRQPVASCSKWLSAATVMTFVDEGKLSLNDTIGKFLPVMTAHGKGGITIWQCLSHLTGIRQTGIGAAPVGNGENEDNGDMPQPIQKTGGVRARLRTQREGGDPSKLAKVNPYRTMAEAMDSITAQPMEGAPGKTFHYGNTGLQIAAAVIEKISGKDFKTLFLERIARPCGMANTDFGNRPVPLAAGSALSTPADYLKFLEMILANGIYNGRQVLSAASVAAMQVNRAAGAKVIYSPAEAGNWGYGFGEWTMNSATDRSASVTSPGLFGSFPWVENEKQYCAFLFTVNLKNKGRGELYKALKRLIDAAVQR